MPQMQDEAGNIWEVDAQGNAVALVAPAGAGQVFTLPASPKEQAAAARQANNDALNAQDKAADNARADEELDLKRELAGLNAELKKAQIEKARGGSGGEKLRDRLSRLGQLVNQINRVQTLYDDSIGTTKGIGGVQDYLPTDDNRRFDAAGAALSQQGLAAFRVPGTGTVSDRDAIMFDRANLPTAATRDSAIEEQLLGLRSRVEAELDALGQPAPQWGSGQRAEDELDKVGAISETSPSGLPPENPQTPADLTPPQTVAQGDYRFADNPRARSVIASLINAGAGYATVAAAAKEAGGRAPTLQQFNTVRKWMKDNPGQEYPASAVEAGEYVPLTSLQKVAGSAPGAFAANYANTATAGIAGAMAGDRGKGALDAMQAMSPTASTLGSLAGGITGALGAEAALAARVPAALAKFAPRAADALYGATLGFNEADEGEGAQGALIGGVTGLAGGLVGQKVTELGGRALHGVTDPAVKAMRAAGVPMTGGQVLGGMVKAIEDRATSAPMIGDMIVKRRMEGLEGFNRAAMNEAGSPIGARVNDIGTEGVQELLDRAGEAYDNATAGVTVPLDQQWGPDWAAVVQSGGTLPNDYRLRLGKALENRVNPINDAGQMTGESYQQAVRGLKGYRASAGQAAPGFEQDYRDTLGAGIDALTAQMVRGGGDSVVSGLRAADDAYRGIKTVQNAAERADGAGYVFTPSQLQDALKVTNRKYPGTTPLTDLADAGQAVLPSRIPDSGTPGRAAQLVVPGLAGAGGGYAIGGADGAGTGTAAGATLAALLALGGTKTGQRALTSALLDRPTWLSNTGDLIARNAQIGGWTGAGILSPMLIGAQ